MDASRAINLDHALNVCITQHSRWPALPLFYYLLIHFICYSGFIPPLPHYIIKTDENTALIFLLHALPICKWDLWAGCEFFDGFHVDQPKLQLLLRSQLCNSLLQSYWLMLTENLYRTAVTSRFCILSVQRCLKDKVQTWALKKWQLKTIRLFFLPHEKWRKDHVFVSSIQGKQ